MLKIGVIGAGQIEHLTAEAFDHPASVGLGIGQGGLVAAAGGARRAEHDESETNHDQQDQDQQAGIHGAQRTHRDEVGIFGKPFC